MILKDIFCKNMSIIKILNISWSIVFVFREQEQPTTC